MATGRIPINGTAAIQSTIVDAKGDLIAATADNTVARLAVGADDTILVADSSEATGLKWATPAGGGGKVLQVVAGTTTTAVNNATDTYADTGLTATITPTLASSKILVLVSQNGCAKSSDSSSNNIFLRLFRGATNISDFTKGGINTFTASDFNGFSFSVNVLDTPATTSAIVYKTQFKNGRNGARSQVQYDDDMSTITLLEIGA